MKKVISVLITLCISTVALVGCGNKEKDKNNDLDIAKRKIEQNASKSTNSDYTSTSSLKTKKSSGNLSNSNALSDFENKIKQDNEELKKAYYDKIKAQKSATELKLNEKLNLDIERLNIGLDKTLKSDATLEEKKKKRRELIDKYKEELKKQNKLYDDKNNNVNKVFDDYDNKIKEAETKRDTVIDLIKKSKESLSESNNDGLQSKEKEVAIAAIKKYMQSLDEIVKWRNSELKKIK